MSKASLPFDGKRLLAMRPEELRWMDNLKKAVYECDKAIVEKRAENDAYPAMCKAVDVAATLHLSLQTPLVDWKAPPKGNNKTKFVNFLHTEIPDSDDQGLDITLTEARTGKPERYNYGGLLYAIRCSMLHENENLNAEEKPDYHVILDWGMPVGGLFGTRRNGRLTLNAKDFLWRVREVLVKFITGTEMFMALERSDKSFSVGINRELMSIFPGDGLHRTK